MEHLSDVDVRVLGSLMEKEVTTPDYYPLSLNALTTACNQTLNRDPVVNYEESAVSAALDHLRRMSLARSIKRVDSRVTKFSHNADETLNLSAREKAVLCTLMLRGPQTMGELKSRASRMAELATAAEVEAVLESLAQREGVPLVTHLPRRAGQKEGRYAHLLSGDVPMEVNEPGNDPASSSAVGGVDRVAALEEKVEELKREVADLRTQLEGFRRQFE